MYACRHDRKRRHSRQPGPEAAILPARGVHLKASTSAEPLHTHAQLQVAIVLFITAVGGPQDPTPPERCT